MTVSSPGVIIACSDRSLPRRDPVGDDGRGVCALSQYLLERAIGVGDAFVLP